MTTRMMVIDDTPEIRARLEELLTEEGHEVVVFASGIPDLDDVGQVQPDLIILDHIIAGEGVGLSLLRQLHEQPSTAQIPVIVCTSATRTMEEVADWLQASCVQVVLKPFAIDDMLHAVQHTLEASRRGILPAESSPGP